MMLYGSGWNCSPFWGTVLDIYKTLSCKSFIQKKKIPTYLPTSKMMGRSTANIQFFKDGLDVRTICSFVFLLISLMPYYQLDCQLLMTVSSPELSVPTFKRIIFITYFQNV